MQAASGSVGQRSSFNSSRVGRVAPVDRALHRPARAAPEAHDLGSAPPESLSIVELYEQVDHALANAFPRSRQLWVRGEIQSISEHGRSGHCYMDVVDPSCAGDRQAPVLRVKCWRTTWEPLRRLLSSEGIELAAGTAVVMRGVLDFYRPRAEVGFILAEVDITSLLGRLAEQRAALIRALSSEGLLDRNRTLAPPEIPLRIGLVASPGTEGYRDFLGQLDGSGFAFVLTVFPTPVQGAEAPGAIAAALGGLNELGPAHLDLIVVVRGGGSKADLVAFDSEVVARAIALSDLPVWTGIGHTGDESVADLVAQRSCITQTACGQEIVEIVGSWWEREVVTSVARLGDAVESALERVGRELVDRRGRIATTARLILERHLERVGQSVATLLRSATRVLTRAEEQVTSRSRQAGPLVLGHLARAEADISSRRRLLSAYDVDRQLARGYTLTLDGDGRVVSSVSDLGLGSLLTTRFHDGEALSAVSVVSPVSAASSASVAPGGSPVIEGGQGQSRRGAAAPTRRREARS